MNKRIIVTLLTLVLTIAMAIPMAVPVSAAINPLVGLWHFDGDSKDSSGNNYNGTFFNPSYSSGVVGQAAALYGGSYVDVGIDVDNQFSPVSFEAWIYPYSQQRGTIISNSFTWGTYKGYDFFLWPAETGAPNGQLVLDFGNGSYCGRTSWNIPTGWYGKWHHVAATWDGAYIRLYVDKTQVSQIAYSGTYSPPSGNTYIGALNYEGYGPWNKFYGLIDEVRIWSTTLTQAQLDDRNPPAITITTPADGASYHIGQTINANWNVSDDGGTGVASANGTVASGSPINTAGLGTYEFTVTARDYAGNTISKTVTYSVTNNSPTIDAGGPYNIDEGSTITVTASGSDPDGDQVTYKWDLDYDGTFETLGISVTFSAASLDGPATKTIVARVTDEHGASATDTATVSINNIAPAVNAGPDQTVNEGEAVSFSGSFVDPCSSDTHTILWDFGDGSTDSGSLTPPHAYADDGSFTVTLTVTDDDGRVGQDTLVVTVNNVAPVVGPITGPLDPVKAGTIVTAGSSFTDSGVKDTHTAVWNWGDGIFTDGSITETNGSGSVSGSHIYANPGVYIVTLTVSDKDGGSSIANFHYVVVYDPNAGFVTGGGWILSPPGAYTPNNSDDPDVTGKATFGFVAKYKKGANVPEGNTEFQFKAGNLNFKSIDYEWLVIAGFKAQFKGTGTINGMGEYKFMLTAVDGSPGKFRIKIWDKITEEIIYDNQTGEADTADPATALGGGSIIIHK